MLCEVDRGVETGLQSLRDAKLRRYESYLEWVRNNLSLCGEFQSPEKICNAPRSFKGNSLSNWITWVISKVFEP